MSFSDYSVFTIWILEAALKATRRPDGVSVKKNNYMYICYKRR